MSSLTDSIASFIDSFNATTTGVVIAASNVQTIQQATGQVSTPAPTPPPPQYLAALGGGMSASTMALLAGAIVLILVMRN